MNQPTTTPPQGERDVKRMLYDALKRAYLEPTSKELYTLMQDAFIAYERESATPAKCGQGEEIHQPPIFEFVNSDGPDGPCFFWKNPYNGKREKVASLWWPWHPPTETEAIEALYESLELRVKSATPASAPQTGSEEHQHLLEPAGNRKEGV